MYLMVPAQPYNGPTGHKFTLVQKRVYLSGLIRVDEGRVLKACSTNSPLLSPCSAYELKCSAIRTHPAFSPGRGGRE
jgi:hypothetical protein